MTLHPQIPNIVSWILQARYKKIEKACRQSEECDDILENPNCLHRCVHHPCFLEVYSGDELEPGEYDWKRQIQFEKCFRRITMEELKARYQTSQGHELWDNIRNISMIHKHKLYCKEFMVFIFIFTCPERKFKKAVRSPFETLDHVILQKSFLAVHRSVQTHQPSP